MGDFFLTKLSASLLTLFYLFLSFRIGYLRGSPVMKLFFKMDKEISKIKLERNVRAHGNFSEYLPLFLVLLFFAEYFETFNDGFLVISCLIFIYGRVSHAICFAFYNYNPFLRISGMICTYLILLILSITLLLNSINI